VRILILPRYLNICLLLVTLTGCSSGGVNRIDGAQYLPVDAFAENKVALLRGFSVDEPEEARNAYKDFENCIRRGLKDVGSRVNLVRWGTWSRSQESAVLNRILEQPRGFELDDDARRVLSELDIQYLVKVGVEDSSTNKKTSSDLPIEKAIQDPGEPVLIFSQEWTETARMRALIYETETGRLSGELSAALTEEAYWGIGVVFWIIPLPYGYSPDVEHGACKSLGTALGRFFNGAGNEHIEPYVE
jgi:hypothetical protein